MIASAEIGPDGEVRFNRPPADQRFVEPYSGLYFQISGTGARDFPRARCGTAGCAVNVGHDDVKPHLYDSNEVRPDEPLRIVERDVDPARKQVRWRFQVAQSRETLDEQIRTLALDPVLELLRCSASA